MRAAMAFLGVCLLATALGMGWWAPIERSQPLQAVVVSEQARPAPEQVAAPIALEPAVEATAEEPPAVATLEGAPFYTSANVRLRSGPSSNFSIVWTAPVGTSVRSLQVDGNWHFVRAGDYEGWMYNRYLSETAP